MRVIVKNILSLLCLVFLGSLGVVLTGCSSLSEGEQRAAMVLPELSCVAVLPTAVPVFSSDTIIAAKDKGFRESGAYIDTDSGGDMQHQLLTQSQPNVSSSGIVTAEKKQSLQDGAVYIDSVLVEELGGRPEFQLLTESQLDAILSDPWGGRLQQVRDIGQATGCGGVLKTTISRYRQRVGGDVSVDTAASAAFSMELIGVESGVVAWTTSFDETQQPLSENIFSFRKAQNRGFKWLSVEDLTLGGVKNRLEEFPYFQETD